MKHSIRRQFALFFIGLMVITIGLCYVINSLFLEKYYSSKKVNTLKSAYSVVNQVIGTDSATLVDELNRLCTVSNIAICVIDTESETMYVSKNGGRELEASLYRHIFGMNDEVADELEATKTYIIEQTKGREGDFLTLFGTAGAGASVIMRTPLESIRESAGIANEFYAYVGIACGLLGAVAFWFAAGRISKPIKKLSDISEQMVHLNFEAKYEGKAKNEIGLLGSNINKLSSALETTIGELKTANNELQKDIEKKEQIDEMRKEFLSNVSHELKTPIALIQGYAEGLQEIAEDEESRAYYCEVIVDEAAKMNRLVQKLLTLNQLEFGNEVVTLERFDLSGLLNNYIQSAKLLAEQQGIAVEMKEYDPLFVWGDELKTEEVITNYFSNAVNYCSGEKKIVIKLETNDKKARVSVLNTGEQIPEEALPHLWEKFYKVDKARTREYGGSGVGLSIVKAIQDSMNQAYGVENCENGVLFWFELDLCEKTERIED